LARFSSRLGIPFARFLRNRAKRNITMGWMGCL
jgi:hypothetical protein